MKDRLRFRLILPGMYLLVVSFFLLWMCFECVLSHFLASWES